MLRSFLSLLIGTVLVVVTFGQLSVDSVAMNARIKADSLIAVLPTLEDQQKGRAFIIVVSSLFDQDIQLGKQFIDLLKQYALDTQDTILLISTTASTAEYHWRKGDFQSALPFALESIEIASTNDKFSSEQARGFQTVGTIHLYLLNTEEALYYYRKAARLYRVQNQTRSLASVNNNSGVIFMDAAREKKKPELLDSAIYYFRKVLDFEGKNRPGTELNASGNLIGILVEINELDEAARLLERWVQLEKEHPNKQARAMNYGFFGKLFLERGELDQAKKFIEEGLQLAFSLDASYEVAEYKKLAAEYNARIGNYKQAYLLNEESWLLRDSVFNVQKVNKINELEERYQSAEKEKLLELKDAELAAQRQSRIRLLLIVGLISLSALTVFILYASRKKNLKLLAQQNQALSEINSTKNKLFALVSHDLRSPLSAFSSITRTLTNEYENLGREKVKKYLTKLERSSEELNSLLTNLLSWSLNQLESIKVNTQQYSIKEIVDESIVSLKSVAEENSLQLHVDLDEAIQVEVDKEILKTAIRNIVSNSIKFTPSGGTITIASDHSKDATHLIIRDTGEGIPEDMHDQLFVLDKKLKHPKSGTGLGLILSRELLEKIKASIRFNPKYSNGAEFIFSIPAV
ncbi:MAG: ATP-binding protein [Bacteroidota bacterium]